MLAACLRDDSLACIHIYCSVPSAKPIIPKLKQSITTTTTDPTSSPLQEVHFTNHESLPSLSDAFSSFISAHPHYTNTELADRTRDSEYSHLSNHICLDYTGFSLFSHAQLPSSASSSRSESPFFNIAYKSASLKSQVRYGNQEAAWESALQKRIMRFLNISDKEYAMICTANRTSAFKILAESYPFRTNKRLLTVYDYESEAVKAIAESAQKRGAKVMSAEFSWPNMKICSKKLAKMVSNTKKKERGLFIIPPQSRLTGTRYPFQWMNLAQENGWHVMLDACSMGPKDMNKLGLLRIKPDFIICSFFKVLGKNPAGFAGLFIKRSSSMVLETSIMARSIGIVSIIPHGTMVNEEVEEEDDDDKGHKASKSSSKIPQSEKFSSCVEIKCKGLDHADSMALLLINRRLGSLTNWLVHALMNLKHPRSEDWQPLVKIYGPRVTSNRGPALAFNVFNWEGEKVEPALVQKLADRSNISIGCGFLHNIWFSDKYDVKEKVLERKISTAADDKREEKSELGINVLSISLCFLNNFEDAYRLWSFISKFLDADFIEKEKWRYISLNQEMVEV